MRPSILGQKITTLRKFISSNAPSGFSDLRQQAIIILITT
jgi:hypothetical protein